MDVVDLAGASREQLVAMVRARDAQIAAQDAQITVLLEQVRVLGERVGGLEAQLTATRATSRTSSKPPSSEGYTKPAPTSRRTRSGRRPGGQAGGAGTTLRQVQDPDEVFEYAPSACGGCGSSLTDAPVVAVAARQVPDLPPVALRWSEHRVASVRCTCGHVTAAGTADGLPAWAVGPVQYGPGVRAAATYLANSHFLPIERTAALMSDLLGAHVSPGSVAAWHAGAGQVLTTTGGFTEVVAAALRGQEVLHADETGLRVAGALAWVHVACTRALSLFTVHTGAGRRGRGAIEHAGVISALAPSAVLVTDAWGPYLSYDTLHALCGAHVVRELRAAAEGAPARTTDEGAQTWAAKMMRLLEGLNTDVNTARRGGATALDPALLTARMTAFESVLALGHTQNPPPSGGWPGAGRRPKVVNLLLRIEARRGDYLRFTTDFAVPFTNNQAERDLRGVRLKEKVSGCLRTLTGAQAFVAIRSYLSTAAKQGQNALTVLRALHEGHPWAPAIAAG